MYNAKIHTSKSHFEKGGMVLYLLRVSSNSGEYG